MKRVGNLMPLITAPDNLRESFLLAARGKSSKEEVRRFRENLDENLQRIAEELNAATYDFSRYRQFMVYEPKPRVINAAPFVTRVALQAMMRVCHNVFDDYQIFDSYASRVGKGTYKALERGRQYARRHRWFAKLDVKSYFASIDHYVMKRMLCRLFKDNILLENFQNIIDSYSVEPYKGLPIGNLSSQYFANHYLSVADRYAKSSGVKAMVRYMDDVLFFGDDKSLLINQINSYARFVSNKLLLKLHVPVINKTHHGVPFLGYVIYGDKMRLNANSRRRFRRRMSMLCEDIDVNSWPDDMYNANFAAMLSFIQKADSLGFRKKIFGMLS